MRLSANCRCPEPRSDDGQTILECIRTGLKSCPDLVLLVELSGLEPLTSCMPCRPISSVRLAGSPIPARQAACVVWLGPVLAVRVWVRSHLVCHWLFRPHHGGETCGKQRLHPWPNTLPDQGPSDSRQPHLTGTCNRHPAGLASDRLRDDHRMAGGRPWLTASSGSPPPWPRRPAVAAVISYRHADELVTTHGETGLTARLLPFTVDAYPGGQHAHPRRQPAPPAHATVGALVPGCRHRRHHRCQPGPWPGPRTHRGTGHRVACAGAGRLLRTPHDTDPNRFRGVQAAR